MIASTKPIIRKNKSSNLIKVEHDLKNEQYEIHRYRVIQELKAAGMSRYGFIKLETRELPKIIHPREHIKAVVYGRGEKGLSMMIATDCRIIYLDKKFFSVSMDEITYDVVSGISYSQAGYFMGITLHTRIGDFSLKFVSKAAAHIFVEYIESHRLEHGPITGIEDAYGYENYVRQMDY